MFNPANQPHFTLEIDNFAHDFQVLAFDDREALYQPYRFDIGLVSERNCLDLDNLLHRLAFLHLGADGTLADAYPTHGRQP
ncbi:hypothetical protein D9M70_525530 [compost metagenome]